MSNWINPDPSKIELHIRQMNETQSLIILRDMELKSIVNGTEVDNYVF